MQERCRVTDSAFLELRGVRKEFASHVAVEGFDLDVARGEFVSFLGPSGCGKTTTLRMIAGFELPTSGAIRIDGRDISRVSPNARNVGMVFQSYALFPNMTAADNIAFGLKVRKRPNDAIKARVAELLELIGLTGNAGKYPYELSGGMQQRVALARALAIEPQVLLLDEPLSALDAKIRLSLRQEIRSIQRQLGITTVYVTHDQEEALSLSDRIVVMSHGRIEQVGAPSTIYNFPATEFVARFVGTLNILSAQVAHAAAGRVTLHGQVLRAAGPITGASTGDSVTIALRPEAVTLGADPSAANALAGRLEDISFLGSVVRVRVRLDGGAGTVLFDTFNNPNLALPQRGEPVTITFPAEACLVLAAGSSAPGANVPTATVAADMGI
jgi:putative spermidine/putrescine transport system ATP-binding protein